MDPKQFIMIENVAINMSQVTHIERSIMPGSKEKAFAIYLVSMPVPRYINEDAPAGKLLKELWERIPQLTEVSHARQFFA